MRRRARARRRRAFPTLPVRTGVQSILRPRPGVDALSGGTIDHGDPEIGVDADLARKADVWRQLSFLGQPELLHLARRRDLSAEHLDPAGRALGIAAAPMHDV